jgi:ATP-dependent Clp protease ATP-binding subunit ClpA
VSYSQPNQSAQGPPLPLGYLHQRKGLARCLSALQIVQGRVVVLAQEEARMLNHNYIGTEHILLGLIHEGEGVAAKGLESLGISLEAVRSQVEEIIGQGQQAPSGHIPFTPRAKKVLELSLREALQLGHNYIGTEHILLGLIREGEGVAAQVLVKLGADLSRVRQQVISITFRLPRQRGSYIRWASRRSSINIIGIRSIWSQLNSSCS